MSLFFWRLGFGLEAWLAFALLLLAAWWFAVRLAWRLPFTPHVLAVATGLLAAGAAACLLLWACVRTPSRRRVALGLEAAEPRFAGSLLSTLQALEQPQQVPPAVAGVAAEHACVVLRACGARPLRPRLPWAAGHVGILAAVVAQFLAGALGAPSLGGLLSQWQGAWSSPDALQAVPAVAASPETAAAVTPAATQQLFIRVTPPAYTGRAAREWSNPGEVQALTRSKVEVWLTPASPAAPLTRAAELPGGQEANWSRLRTPEGGPVYYLAFPADRAGPVRLQAPAVTGEPSAPVGDSTVLFALSIQQDMPPSADARIVNEERTAAGSMPPRAAARREEGLPVELRVSDDFGLLGVRLVLRPLPPEERRTPSGLPAEWVLDVPLERGASAVTGRWWLPARGLEAWLAAGFQYRVEALDNAEPVSQLGLSSWRRWEPPRGASGAEPVALFEPPRSLRPRSLARPDAFSRIPDLTPQDLAQLRASQSAAQPPRQLERPPVERLEDTGATENARGSVKTPETPPPGQGSGERRRSEYEFPPDALKPQKPPPAGEATPPGETAGAGRKPGEQEGRTSAGEGGGRGASESGSGKGTSDSGSSPGGAGAGTETRPRDGGRKTGREVGPGNGDMAPPDAASLARMQGVTPDEVRKYAAGKGPPAGAADTSSGEKVLTGPPGQGEKPVTPLGAFAVPPSARAPGAAQGPATDDRLRNVDPVYRPLVEGYFLRRPAARTD